MRTLSVPLRSRPRGVPRAPERRSGTPRPSGRFDRVELVLGGSSRVEVHGLGDVEEPDGGWSELLTISVASARRVGGPAMVGTYALDAGILVFTPRFELQPALEYTAVLRRALLPDATGSEADLVRTFVLPRTTPAVPPEITAVYPSGASLARKRAQVLRALLPADGARIRVRARRAS